MIHAIALSLALAAPGQRTSFPECIKDVPTDCERALAENYVGCLYYVEEMEKRLANEERKNRMLQETVKTPPPPPVKVEIMSDELWAITVVGAFVIGAAGGALAVAL